MTKATFTLKSQQRGGIKRPVIHVLTADDRVTEFKDRGIVVAEDGSEVFAALINGRGEPYVFADGTPAVVSIPVVQLGLMPDPEKWLSWKELARKLPRTDPDKPASISTAKRWVKEGKLPRQENLGKRKIGFRQGDVDAALEKMRKG